MNIKNKGDMLGAILALLLGILNLLATESGLLTLSIGFIVGAMSCLVFMICSMRLDLLCFDEGTVLYRLYQMVQDQITRQKVFTENEKKSILTNEVNQLNLDHVLKET